MTTPDLYPDAPVPIRPDILAEQMRAWRHIASAGSWFTGAERLAVAAETRAARTCALCASRKAALSPNAVDGGHDHSPSGAKLPAALIEVVHRVTTDPARLSKSWHDGVMADGLDAERYVEAVGVAVHTISLDTFAAGLGLPPRPLPAAQPGAPSGYRPKSAKMAAAWVPLISPGNEDGAEINLYGGMMGAYIQQALTLVPDEQRSWFSLCGAQYMAGSQMRDFSTEPRAITHAQIEFVAGRISALNECRY